MAPSNAALRSGRFAFLRLHRYSLSCHATANERRILGFITHPPLSAVFGFLESRSPHRPRRTPTVFVVRPALTMRASDRSIHIRLIFRTIRKLISAKASLLTINLVDTDPAWKPQGVNKES